MIDDESAAELNEKISMIEDLNQIKNNKTLIIDKLRVIQQVIKQSKKKELRLKISEMEEKCKKYSKSVTIIHIN